MLVVFESHATTLDNEAGLASGWNDVALSKLGKQQAAEMGQRYRLDDLDAIYCSDLQRSYETAKLAFPGINSAKLFIDWRLRECNYGDVTQHPSKEIEATKPQRISEPFPHGESYNITMKRMKSFLDDLRTQDFQQVLIIGSRATQFGLDYWINKISLNSLVSAKFVWQPGWEYKLT